MPPQPIVGPTSDYPTSLHVRSVEHPGDNEALFVLGNAVGCNRPKTVTGYCCIYQERQGLASPHNATAAPTKEAGPSKLAQTVRVGVYTPTPKPTKDFYGSARD